MDTPHWEQLLPHRAGEIAPHSRSRTMETVVSLRSHAAEARLWTLDLSPCLLLGLNPWEQTRTSVILGTQDQQVNAGPHSPCEVELSRQNDLCTISRSSSQSQGRPAWSLTPRPTSHLLKAQPELHQSNDSQGTQHGACIPQPHHQGP